MAKAKCGQIFSWDTPMWCRPKDNNKMCDGCPLNIKFKDRDEETD